MEKIGERISGHRVIGLDTSIFIYHLEGNPTYSRITTEILALVESGQCQGVISTVTIMELTVMPWRINRPDVARHYEALLVKFPNLIVKIVTRSVARQAARLRAVYHIRPADAILVATAMNCGATIWISNDLEQRRLKPEIDVVILDDYI